MLVCPVCHHELPVASIPSPANCNTSAASARPTPLCHVTPHTPQPQPCRLRPSCHVYPYTCGCSLSHRTSLPTNNLFYNAPSHTQTMSNNNNLDLSSLKLSNNFTSCPTSPLPNTSQDSNPFQHLNSKLMCGGSNCSFQQPQHTPLHRVTSLSHNTFQCPEEQLAANHHMCNNGVCLGSKPGFRRQSSCPNAPCMSSLACVCVPEHTQEPVMPPSTILTSTTTTSLPPNHQLTTQIQFQYADHQTSPNPSIDNNIVILNTTGSGGVIIENKIPSRTNSPDFNISLATTNNKSGHSTPDHTNTIDREHLMQTLASLPSLTNLNLQLHNNHHQQQQHCNNSLNFTTSPFGASSQQQIKVSNDHHHHQQVLFTRSPNSSPLSFEHRSLECPIDSTSELKVTSTDGRFRLNVMNTVLPSPVCGRLPTPSTYLDSWSSDDDARVLRNAKAELEESGFYYGGLTWREANDVLSGASEGSFLVRDSWSGRCLYALSIKTAVGPTSVRIEYERGRFMLQSENKARVGVPQRSCVVGLIQAYIETYNPGDVWVDHSGRTVSAITVTKPLRKTPPSLQHLARLAYHTAPSLHKYTFRTLPNLIKSYVKCYSHTC